MFGEPHPLPTFYLVNIGVGPESAAVQVRQPLAGVEQKNSSTELHEAGEERSRKKRVAKTMLR